MLRIHWPSEYEGDGNSLGYAVHNDRARAALLAQGFRLDPAAPVALQVAPAHMFRPVPGKLNILFTAWESTDLTPEVKAGAGRADVLIVPATFLVDAFRRELPAKPVHRCPLGVDVDTFPFRERRPPGRGERFRFLWLGAPNARKGWETVREAWRGYARLVLMGEVTGRRLPPAELYVKTSVTSRLAKLEVPGAPVTFDSRRLPTDDLARLYHSAHAFLFPSFGEGFGLTMAEAMATGCPVIFTPWSAMADLADGRCGYPLRYRLIRHDLAGRDARRADAAVGSSRSRSGGPARARSERGDAEGLARRGAAVSSSEVTFAQADAPDLLRRMIEVMGDYRRAARKGRHAARRIGREFTWERTGRTLAEILRTECGRRGIG